MLTVALTGNIGSGKSTVARIWSDAGIPVIRADDLARMVVEPGSNGLARVVEEFGREVLLEDGSLDRKRMGGLVFGDPSKRTRLEEILHPLIGFLRNDWVSHHRNAGTPLIVAEIPLLFEVGLEKDFDAVVLVVAPDEERLRRLMDDRGIDKEVGTRMMAAQIPAEEKLMLADYVLENGGSMEDLEIRSLALLDLLRARARAGGRRAP